MLSYVVRRLLLMVPTFLGTTFLVFLILDVAPGGPFERALMQLKHGALSGEGTAAASSGIREALISQRTVELLRKQYGLDRPFLVRYLIWMGLCKRELKSKTLKIGESFREDLRYIQEAKLTYAIQKWVRIREEKNKIKIEESGVGSDFKFSEGYNPLPESQDIIDWEHSTDWSIGKKEGAFVLLVKKKYSGILTGDLGVSYVYDEPVLELIRERLPISCYFGFLGFFLSYVVCIPLGIWKALKHGSFFDHFSSLLVFIGYSIPGYVLGALLLVYFGGGSFWNGFPLGGFHSEGWEQFTVLGKTTDLLHHTFLPVLSYTIGSFATLTVLMKNSLLENLNQDYIRTAYSKGLSEKRVIWVHALKNSLIPVATSSGHLIGLFLAGSYLIEKVFNIDGIGMLSFTSILNSDYPVVLGFLAINTVLLLLGNLLSDIAYALIDPRIRFQ